jgi:hypothetical protein
LKDKLNILIDYYEAEKDRLLHLIDSRVKEEEYQLAYFHQRALYQLNGRLQTLRNINDKFHDEKSFISDRISNLEKRMGTESSDVMNDYYLKELERAEEELEKLIRRSDKADTTDDKLILDKALSDLVDRKIKSFTLVLKRKDNLLLEFKYYRKVLKVTLPFVKRHLKNYMLYEGRVNKLQRFGFGFQNNDSKLVLKLNGDKEKVINNLKVILSKIIFEVFYFKEFENESYIEINGKAST